MSNAKISAFAKRRRLNDGSAAEATGSDSSVSIDVKTKIDTTSKKTRKRETIQAKPLLIKPLASDPEVFTGENSFEPLVEAQAVKFTGIREIEEIGRKSCKVRLSRGQQCSLTGTARLWVRDGSVEVYGAALHESPHVHTVFAPYIENAVSITSVSKIAEFQLESVETSHSSVPSPLNLPGQYRSKSNDLSFSIVDFDEHSASQEKRLGVQFRSNARQDVGFKSVLKQLTSKNNACVLISGKRSSTTAHASLKLINAVLSEPAVYHAAKCVAILDLDPSSPIRTTPGTVSLIYQRDLMLGPPYAYPLQASIETSMLISSVYTGVTDGDGADEMLRIVESMLNSFPETRKMPLIIRGGKWLAAASVSTLTNLSKMLAPSLVLSIDRTKSSAFYEAAVTVAGKGSVLEHVPELGMHLVPSLTEHRCNLRSHFLFHGYVEEVPIWYRNLAAIPRTHSLEISTDSSALQLSFLMLSGGMVRADDVADLLTASLVTVVAKDLSTSEQDSALHVQHFQRNLNLRYIGIAFVESFDMTSKTIKLNTTITEDLLESYRSKGLEIGMVLEKPGPEGQFSRHMLRD